MIQSQAERNIAIGGSYSILLILSTLMAFASISTDLYLPAMPAIAADLHADVGRIEFTISAYLIGFSLGQLFWGPMSDQYGRRMPIIAGIVLFILGSAGCAMANSVHEIIFFRIIQALGACANVVLSRAIVRDLYVGNDAAKMLSALMTVMAVAPLIGPSLGGAILQFGNWRNIFEVLVIIGALTLFAMKGFPETLKPELRKYQSVKEILVTYGSLLKNKVFMRYAAVSGVFYGGMFAYIAGTPYAYITYYHVSPQAYGVLFASGILGIMITNQINSRLVTKFGISNLIFAGALISTVAGILLVLNTLTGVGGLFGLVVGLFIFVSCTGLIVANSIAGALSSSENNTGSASALIGVFQYGTGILGSGLVGIFADGTLWPLVLVITMFALLTLYWAVKIKTTRY
ncbi:MAG: multidrug effflux MFS transporter [Pseudomonadota bacterium]